jgi:hypothetical protein
MDYASTLNAGRRVVEATTVDDRLPDAPNPVELVFGHRAATRAASDALSRIVESSVSPIAERWVA